MKLKAIVSILVTIAAVQSGARAASEDLVSAVAAKQMDRPYWFLPLTALLPDIAFVYEARSTFTVQRDGDAELKMTAIATQEIVLGKDWEQVRTVSLRTGGTGRDHETLTGIRSILFSRYRTHLAALDKQRLSELRAHGPAEKRRIWTEFFRAFRFERMANQARNASTVAVVRFTPRPGYVPSGAVDTGFLPRIKGELWIDERDLEIARLSYEFIADSPEFMSLGPVRKRTRYAMDLAKSIDGAWLPVRAETELFRRTGSSEAHDTYTVEFGKYRRFDVNVTVRSLGEEPGEDRQ